MAKYSGGPINPFKDDEIAKAMEDRRLFVALVYPQDFLED